MTKRGPENNPVKLPGVAPVTARSTQTEKQKLLASASKNPLPDSPHVAAKPQMPPEIEAVSSVEAAPALTHDVALPAESASLASSPPQPTISVLAESAKPDQKGHIFMATIAPQFSSEKVQAMFGDLNERAKSTFEKSTKFGEEFADLAKGNVEAIVTSARVAAKGTEALAQEAADYSKKSFETATTAFKSFATVKSPTELFQLQSDYAKSSFDSAVAEASKMSETWMKLVGEIFQPISSRYAVAAEKINAVGI